MQAREFSRSMFVLLAFSLALSTACSEQPVAAVAAEQGGQAVAENTTISDEPSRGSSRESSKENCINCGEVTSITAVTEDGESTGVGAALGAIVGGIAGNQVGGGSGKKIATVAGAVGGAVAGNTIEKNRGSETMYDVRIEMENGREQTIRVPDATGISVGSNVTVEGNQIYLR
jgi:outer membrane lipoprotein SlyB